MEDQTLLSATWACTQQVLPGVTGPQSLSDRLGEGHALRVPSRTSKVSYPTTPELIHPTACFKSELHFKGEKKPQPSSCFGFITSSLLKVIF